MAYFFRERVMKFVVLYSPTWVVVRPGVEPGSSSYKLPARPLSYPTVVVKLIYPSVYELRIPAYSASLPPRIYTLGSGSYRTRT